MNERRLKICLNPWMTFKIPNSALLFWLYLTSVVVWVLILRRLLTSCYQRILLQRKAIKEKNVVIYEVKENQSGVGTSGVRLCWHSNEKYGTLNPEQISELHDWRIANGTNQGGPNTHKSKKGTNNANWKGKSRKVKHNNNDLNKLKTKVVALFKAT